jgi:hypothetical protein
MKEPRVRAWPPQREGGKTGLFRVYFSSKPVPNPFAQLSVRLTVNSASRKITSLCPTGSLILAPNPPWGRSNVGLRR